MNEETSRWRAKRSSFISHDILFDIFTDRRIRNRKVVARDCDAVTRSDVQNDGNSGSHGFPADHGTD